MSDNPFEPPEAQLEQSTPLRGSGPPWFAVGTTKLVVMTLVTFGLYSVHWFERQYRFQKRQSGEEIMPLARGLFSVFFAVNLFGRIQAAAVDAGAKLSWTASGLGGQFIAIVVLGRVLDFMPKAGGAGVSVLAAFDLLLVGALALPMEQAQRTINALLERENPGFDRNERYTGWNWLAIILGGVLLVFSVIGIFS